MNRIVVARAIRQFPAVLSALRSGDVYLSGLRLLVPHLREENVETLLLKAKGKTKRQIEEILAEHFPKPRVPDAIRKTPASHETASDESSAQSNSGCVPLMQLSNLNSSVTTSMNTTLDMPKPLPMPSWPCEPVSPLSKETFKIQFTANRALRDKLKEAQDLMRHRVPDGNLAEIFDAALTLLLEKVKKERFAAKSRVSGAKSTSGQQVPQKPQATKVARRSSKPPKARADQPSDSRHIPNAIKRAVYERDGGQCTFVDVQGHRCQERAWIEFDHIDGFARDRTHAVDKIRLLCRFHNLHAAEHMYGQKFMENKRREKGSKDLSQGHATHSVRPPVVKLPTQDSR